MSAVKGIGFDLFGTLALQERFNFDQSTEALYQNLLMSGFQLDKGRFLETYRHVNRRFMAQAMEDGRETHNRLWVAGALQALGHAVEPEDRRIEQAVAAYFDPFIASCRLIPGTREMLERLAGRYRLALLSNFTHPPALDQILARLRIRPFFDAILVSGQIGIRKPHPAVFAELTRRLGLPVEDIIFVGDELQADIVGAQNAGLRTVWMTYRQRLERPSPLGQFLGLAEEAGTVRPGLVIGSWSEFLGALA
jgi:putative hydrolase of the HAD superfamily